MLVTAASYGYAEEAVRPEIRVGQGVMGKVARDGRPILVTDVASLPDYVQGISNARSELDVPMLAREKLIGVFNVESPRPDAFREEDIVPLMTMAGQAAIAIENARLYDNLRSVSRRYQELHQFNSRILKSANLGIYTIDAGMRVTSWNHRMEEMSGVSEEDALGNDLLQLFPVLEEEGFADRVRRVLQRGIPEKVRLAHRNMKGELRFQKRRLAPLKDGDRTTGVVVIVEDITEFKRLLEQTIQSEKLAEVGRLSAGIAHEVNNPLAVISYAAQLLLREEELPPFQKELAERIDSEVDRLKTLTGSLLSFFGPGKWSAGETDLNEVLRDVLRLVRYELNRHRSVWWRISPRCWHPGRPQQAQAGIHQSAHERFAGHAGRWHADGPDRSRGRRGSRGGGHRYRPRHSGRCAGKDLRTVFLNQAGRGGDRAGSLYLPQHRGRARRPLVARVRSGTGGDLSRGAPHRLTASGIFRGGSECKIIRQKTFLSYLK
jgi:PAS domain S-box-containing protein